MNTRSLFPPLVLACFAAAACDPAGPRPGGPAIRAISGDSVTDTIQAQLTEPLVVEVTDSTGAPLRNAAVHFSGANGRVGGRELPGVHVCRTGVGRCEGGGYSASVNTDSRGQARVLVTLGMVADSFPVQVYVPALELADSIWYVVRPGAPAKIRAGVRDSTAYVGASYSLRAAVQDRFGNGAVPRDPIAFSAIGSAAAADEKGVVRGLQIGRGGIVLSSGAFVDTAWITVPPRGTIAAAQGPYGQTSVVKIELDGSARRVVARLGSGAYYGTWPDWSATGQLVYEAGGYGSERMMIADTLGTARRVTSDDAPTRSEVFGAFATDGSVLFTANGGSIWRVAAPGQVPVRIGPNPHINANNWKLSPAPDGRRVVFQSVERGISIMDLATGATTVLRAVHASTGDAAIPRWSPRGDWIVVDERDVLYVIRPDGTGWRRVVPNHGNAPGADWSPDGEWLVARSQGRLELIRVATGEILPLPWSGEMSGPSWKP